MVRRKATTLEELRIHCGVLKGYLIGMEEFLDQGDEHEVRAMLRDAFRIADQIKDDVFLLQKEADALSETRTQEPAQGSPQAQ